MSVTLNDINTLINDRRRDTGSGSVDMSTVGFRAINSTLRIWNELHDWPWTIKQANINYNPGIYTYPLDSIITDFKYPLTLKFYKPGNSTAEFWMVSPLRFQSAILYARRFAIQVVGGVQTINIKSCDGNAAAINTATAYNQNGTWVGDGATVTNVYTDNYEGFDWPSSVGFSFNGTTGTITNSTFSPVNMSIFQNRSNIYFDIFPASVTNITSMTLKVGTNSSNYYQFTSTTDYLGASFQAMWMKIKSSWSNPTTVGTPTITSIGYVQLTITCSGPTNIGIVRMQNFFASENVPLQLTYYSTNMVETAAGVQSQIFANAASTTDLPLWTGRWDIATEPFINAVLEIIFWITGETQDMKTAMEKVTELAEPLKRRFPTQRRYPTMQIITDTNFQGTDNNWFGDLNGGFNASGFE